MFTSGVTATCSRRAAWAAVSPTGSLRFRNKGSTPCEPRPTGSALRPHVCIRLVRDQDPKLARCRQASLSTWVHRRALRAPARVAGATSPPAGGRLRAVDYVDNPRSCPGGSPRAVGSGAERLTAS